jgi:hypothetical protein
MDIPSFIAGMGACAFLVCLWSWLPAEGPRQKAMRQMSEPKPVTYDWKPGDIAFLPLGQCKLPVLLKEELTYGSWKACYITPRAAAMGAKIGDQPIDEMKDWLAIKLDNNMWKRYPHELSDGESANFARAMLQDEQK